MKIPTTRKLHEWIGFSIGAIFVVWLVSGVVMMLPYGDRAAYEGPYGPIDFTAAVVTPEEAVRIATGETEAEALAPIRDLRFGRIEDRLVYKVALEGAGLRMVDARSGEIIEVDEARAERLARQEFDSEAAIVDLRLVDDRDPWYQYGPLPAWRVDFDDARRSISYVAVSDGSVRRSDRITRLKSAIVGTHSFDTLSVVGLLGLKLPALFVASLLGLFSVVTGYYISVTMFARKRRARRERETAASARR